jgi:hypothetical protein
VPIQSMLLFCGRDILSYDMPVSVLKDVPKLEYGPGLATVGIAPLDGAEPDVAEQGIDEAVGCR